MPMYMARLCQHIPSLIHVGYNLNLSVFERASVLGMTVVGWVAKILWRYQMGEAANIVTIMCQLATPSVCVAPTHPYIVSN